MRYETLPQTDLTHNFLATKSAYCQNHRLGCLLAAEVFPNGPKADQNEAEACDELQRHGR